MRILTVSSEGAVFYKLVEGGAGGASSLVVDETFP